MLDQIGKAGDNLFGLKNIERKAVMTKDAEVSGNKNWESMSVDLIISILTNNAYYDWENDNPVIFLNHLLKLKNLQKYATIHPLRVLESKLLNAQDDGREYFALMLGFFLKGVEYKFSKSIPNQTNWNALSDEQLVTNLLRLTSKSNHELSLKDVAERPAEFVNLITSQTSSTDLNVCGSIIAGLRELMNRETDTQTELWQILHFFLSGVDYLRKMDKL